jgi:leucyl aminopeptidase
LIGQHSIMDFELKTLTRARLCAEKCDALVVLVAQEAQGNAALDDPVSKFVGMALKEGDFEAKAGKLLSGYRMPGVAARRVVLAGAGDGSAKGVRTAVLSAVGALKNGNLKRIVISLGAMNSPAGDAVQAAVVACSDAAYAYTTTKSRPAGASLEQVTLAVPDAPGAKAGFDKGVALAKGISLPCTSGRSR